MRELSHLAPYPLIKSFGQKFILLAKNVWNCITFEPVDKFSSFKMGQVDQSSQYLIKKIILQKWLHGLQKFFEIIIREPKLSTERFHIMMPAVCWIRI